MKHRLGAFPFIALILIGVLAPRLVRADLASDIRGVLQDRTLSHAQVGIALIHLGTDPASTTAVFKHESDIPLIPASNLKLVTTSAALDRLGPDFRFRTALVRRGDDIVLVGDGDPTFGDAALLKRVNWQSTTVFARWAQQLKNSGITHVRNVLVDDSVFDQNFVHPSWPVKQQHLPYVAGVAGMNFNANCLDFYIKPTMIGRPVTFVTDPPAGFLSIENDCISGNDNAVWLSREPGSSDLLLKGQIDQSNVEPISVTVLDPPLFAAGVLAEEIKAVGIAMTGQVGRDRTIRAAIPMLPPGSVLAIHETPIAAVLGRANKDSMNLYAEALCKRLGAEVSHQSGSWENGLPALRAFLAKAGVEATQYSLDDGCGLSHKNVISPLAITQVLTYDYFGPNRAAFMDSMGVAGMDGRYLLTRFAGSDLRGRVLLKSGFVNNVSGISGFLHAKDGQWYVFSILMNGIPDGANSAAKLLQERIVRALDASVAPITSAAAGQ
jgi:D-alanyl-D-alanine carboxypeptidase/D-alanyl-D-alanine-endopeptidase (penicillin-binding protein 4)